MRAYLAPIILFGHDIFFDSGLETSDVNDVVENRKYFVKTIQCMETMQFKRHFRMDIDTFEDFVQKLSTVYNASVIGHPEISLEESCLICIWYLGKLESFRGVAARFGVSKSTAWSIVLRICKAITVINQRFGIIQWPNHGRCEIISAHFHNKYNIPGVIRVIDGSHIKIVAPKEHPVSYINRKGYHSIVLQCICDHKKLFTDTYIGEAGSVHDYAVFLKSDVSRKSDEDFPHQTHLIGDLAYRLTTNMLVGFKHNGHLSEQHKYFNPKLSKAKVIIENCFAVLKGRFRRLKLIEALIPEHVCLIVLASTVVHNICVLKGDNANEIEEEIIREQLYNPRNFVDINVQQDYQQVHIKRNGIVNTLLI